MAKWEIKFRLNGMGSSQKQVVEAKNQTDAKKLVEAQYKGAGYHYLQSKKVG